MRHSLFRVPCLLLAAVVIAGLSACSAGGSHMGRLSMSLTDKPGTDFEAVYVTIKEIAVHKDADAEGAWTTILTVNQTFELTALSNGVRKELGIVDLEPGHYTQMRLIIGTDAVAPNPYANYVVDKQGVPHAMKVPSGIQTGLKIVQGFDINANSTTELVFDFDATRSVVVAGNSGQYLLKPTIHMIDDTQTRTIIKGTVQTTVPAPLAGAEVSLQVYDSSLADPKDQVSVYASTLTDSNGAYMFWFLDVPEPTTFNVIATDWAASDKDYAPAWSQIAGAVNGNVYPVDFQLAEAAAVGTLSLKAIVADADTDKNPEPETVVTISIRKLSDLDGAPYVEVRSLPIVGYDDEYQFSEITAVDITLPAGDYRVVASTPDRTTLVQDITVKSGANALDLTFPLPN
jgi:hypothetical protein